MGATTAGIVFIGSLVVALALAYRPLGDYMYRVYSGSRHSRVERVIYRLVGVEPEAEQTWGVYARSVLAFSVISMRPSGRKATAQPAGWACCYVRFCGGGTVGGVGEGGAGEVRTV